MSTVRRLTILIAALVALTGCAKSAGIVDPAMTTAETPVAIASEQHAHGATLLAGFRIAIDPDTLTATVTPHRSGTAQPPQGQRYDLDIANFQNADSLRITGVQVLGSGNFRITFSHAHPFPAPDLANPATGTNRADLGYTGRLLMLTSYNPQSYFSNAVRLSAGAVIAPDGYVETGDLLANTGPALITAYPYKLLADEFLDNRVDLSNGGNPNGNYSPAAGGWQQVNLGPAGNAWTGYDYIHGGQTVTNTLTLGRAALESSNFDLDVALLIQYTDPRGAGGATHRLPDSAINIYDFAYRLPYAALDCSKINYTASLTLSPVVGNAASLQVRVRDWDAGADEAGDATVGDEGDVALIQLDASGAPEVVLDAPGILIGLRNMGMPSGTGLSDAPLLYTNNVVNQEGATAGDYFACLRITDPEFGDAGRGAYHAGVDPTSLIPSAARSIPARTWQLVPITVGPAIPVITAVTPSGIVGAVDEVFAFAAQVTGDPTAFDWNFGGGVRENLSSDATPTVHLASLPGVYTGVVSASNAGGDSAPFAFTYRVLDPQKPDFAFHKIQSSGVISLLPEGDHLILVGDRPVLLWSESNPDFGVRCAVAKVPNPETASDWNFHMAYEGELGLLSCALINGCPTWVMGADVDLGDDAVPIYGRATVPLPDEAADWSVTYAMTPLLGLDYGFPNQLTGVAGRPLIVAGRGGDEVRYCYMSDTAAPVGPSDWSRYQITPDASSFDLTTQTFPEGERALLLLNEDAAGCRVLIATQEVPDTSAFWTPYDITSAPLNSVSVVAGEARIDHSEFFVAAGRNSDHWVQIQQWGGQTAADCARMNFYDLEPTVSPTGNIPVQLAMHNGRPMLQYRSEDYGCIVVRARRPDPVASDWEWVQMPVPIEETSSRITLTSCNNRIGMFALTSGGVYFGMSSGPW